MDIIRARGLTVGYGDEPVLRDLTFEIPKGRITAVVGVSGSGKSTLLKSLAGLLPPLAGGFAFDGREVDYRYEASLRYLYGRIALLLSSFMFGLFAGGLVSSRSRVCSPGRLSVSGLGVVMLLAAFLAVLPSAFSDAPISPWNFPTSPHASLPISTGSIVMKS